MILDQTTNIILHVLALVVFSLLLVKSADLLEDGFVLLAKKTWYLYFIIGFAVLGIASSLTEVFVAVSAANSGVPQLSLGNLLGASVLLLTLIVALNTFVNKKIPFSGSFGRNQVVAALGLMVLGIGSIIDERLSAWEGVILLLAYAGFIYYLSIQTNHQNINEHARVSAKKMWRLLIESSVGLVGLIIFSKLIVDTAVTLSGPYHAEHSRVSSRYIISFYRHKYS
jgi:cation:H+ antiporter